MDYIGLALIMVAFTLVWAIKACMRRLFPIPFQQSAPILTGDLSMPDGSAVSKLVSDGISPA